MVTMVMKISMVMTMVILMMLTMILMMDVCDAYDDRANVGYITTV